jgi:hypothetical protein
MRIDRPVVREFEYRVNRIQAAGLLLLACGGTALLAYFAVYAQGGVKARGIELSETVFRVLAGILAVLSPFGVGCLAASLIGSWTNRQRIAFTADSLILPEPSWHGLSTDEIEIPYADILAVSVEPYSTGTRMIVLACRSRTLMILSNMIPRRRDFNELAAELSRRVAEQAAIVKAASTIEHPFPVGEGSVRKLSSAGE